jgi:uncharacterized protein YicC (UPF0701 family)
MTGYGRATAAFAGGTSGVQVSSVNRRSLDLTVKLPATGRAWRPRSRARPPVAARGKVHVDIEFEPRRGPDEVSWNERRSSPRRSTSWPDLADARGSPSSPTAELLWQIANSQRSAAEVPPTATRRPELLAALDEALRAFAAMRAKEGEALFVDFIERVGLCRRHIDAVAARAPGRRPGLPGESS